MKKVVQISLKICQVYVRARSRWSDGCACAAPISLGVSPCIRWPSGSVYPQYGGPGSCFCQGDPSRSKRWHERLRHLGGPHQAHARGGFGDRCDRRWLTGWLNNALTSGSLKWWDAATGSPTQGSGLGLCVKLEIFSHASPRGLAGQASTWPCFKTSIAENDKLRSRAVWSVLDVPRGRFLENMNNGRHRA